MTFRVPVPAVVGLSSAPLLVAKGEAFVGLRALEAAPAGGKEPAEGRSGRRTALVVMGADALRGKGSVLGEEARASLASLPSDCVVAVVQITPGAKGEPDREAVVSLSFLSLDTRGRLVASRGPAKKPEIAQKLASVILAHTAKARAESATNRVELQAERVEATPASVEPSSPFSPAKPAEAPVRSR